MDVINFFKGLSFSNPVLPFVLSQIFLEHFSLKDKEFENIFIYFEFTKSPLLQTAE